MLSPDVDYDGADVDAYGGQYEYQGEAGELYGEDPPLFRPSNAVNIEDETSPEADAAPPVKVVGKPQVWIRIRPTPSFDNNVFEIEGDNKTLKLVVEPGDRISQKKTGGPNYYRFGTDGILQNSSQDETFQLTVAEVVEKAMEGISGAVVCVGPEISGKSFTLFGPQTKYQFRGVLPRALDRIFELVEERKEEYEYHIVFSMFEIRRDKIKDLLTLGPYELKRVGEYGPNGLFYEEIVSIEQALNLMLRGITGQKQMPREPFAKYHTVAYVDIIAKPLDPESEKQEWRSRITFAKIASMPKRENATKIPEELPQNSDCSYCPEACYEGKKKVKEDKATPTTGKCCRGPLGPLGESISIRKDLSFLEQMFIRAHELRKMNEYYNKLESMGMYMLMKPPKLAPSQYFRQSKLAHCLKDIVSGKTEIRVILHVRPERSYIQSTLEAMRFAERARCIPCNAPKKIVSDPCQTFEQKIAHMCSELGIPEAYTPDGKKTSLNLKTLYSQINPDKMREILGQATTYFEEKLDSLEGSCKDQVKNMFETFRDMWTHMLDQGVADQQLIEDLEMEGEVEAERARGAEHGTQTEEDIIYEEKRKSNSINGSKKKPESNLKVKKSKKNRPSGYKIKGKDKNGKANGDADDSQDELSKKRLGSGTVGNVDSENDPDSRKSTDIDNANTDGGDLATITVRSDETLPFSTAESAQEDTGGSLTDQTTSGRQSGTNENDAFKNGAWDDFAKSSLGGPLLADFVEKQTILRNAIVEHNTVQKDLSAVVDSLTTLQLDLDISEQEKRMKTTQFMLVVPTAQSLNAVGEIKTLQASREELVTRLKEIRSELQAQKQLVEETKKECEQAFQEFCSETYDRVPETKGIPLSTLDLAMTTTTQEALGFAPLEKESTDEDADLMMNTGQTNVDEKEAEISRHFEALKKVAKNQAESLLSSYPKRPPWSMYY